MGDRNLTTKRAQVFGDVEPGTECRICGRDVDDGRAKTCSDYCGNLQSAVMSLLNWSTLRQRIIDRDDRTCQQCGWDADRDRLARDHIREIIDAKLGDRPSGPGLDDPDAIDEHDWDAHLEELDDRSEQRDLLERKYGDPYRPSRELEVDHIVRIADGGHPFDPGNLQTLCSECHGEKTAAENREQRDTPSRGDLSRSILEYLDEQEAGDA